jgi:glycosyltransferase involved in cell wall biosynthesis
MKPLFSVTLIAKNEAKSLPNLLKSLGEFKRRGGEVILVDTGSTDQTIPIAKEWGVKVYEEGPRFIHTIDQAMADRINTEFVSYGEEKIVEAGNGYFDFGEARAYAMSLAENDWVLCPGCDELFRTLDIDKINDIIEAGYWKQLRVDYVWLMDESGRELVRFYRDSYLFDRRVWKWHGCIHECVVSDTNAPWQNLDASIALSEHHQLPQDHRRKRDLTGLAMSVILDPKNDRYAHYFARELMYAHRFRSSIAMFKKHWEMKNWELERAQSLIYIGDCYSNLGDKDEAIRWWHEAFAFNGQRREPLIKLAEHFYWTKNAAKCAAYVEAALTVPYVAYYGNRMEHYTYYPHEMGYWAHYWLGHKEQAHYHWLKCIEYKQDHWIRREGEFVNEFYVDADRVGEILGPYAFKFKKVLYIGATPERQALVAQFIQGESSVDLVELHAPYVEHFKKEGTFGRGELIVGDVTNLDAVAPKMRTAIPYDVGVWWHGPEHIALEDLPKAVEGLKKYCDKVIVCWPLEHHTSGEGDPNPGNLHRSHPTVDDIEALGFKTKVYGKPGECPWPTIIAWWEREKA